MCKDFVNKVEGYVTDLTYINDYPDTAVEELTEDQRDILERLMKHIRKYEPEIIN